MSDALIIGVTVGMFSLVGNIAAGFIVANRLAQVLNQPTNTSGRVAADRLRAELTSR
jgi:hypothetical protein